MGHSEDQNSAISKFKGGTEVAHLSVPFAEGKGALPKAKGQKITPFGPKGPLTFFRGQVTFIAWLVMRT